MCTAPLESILTFTFSCHQSSFGPQQRHLPPADHVVGSTGPPQNGNEIVGSVPCVDKRRISADRSWVRVLCRRRNEEPPPDMGRPVRPQSHGRLLYFQLLSHYLDYKDEGRAGRMNKGRALIDVFILVRAGAESSAGIGAGTFLLHSTGYHRLIALLDSPPPLLPPTGRHPSNSPGRRVVVINLKRRPRCF